MATVAELRTSFKKDTLRFDKTDAEIDRFLNAGQKWLTRNYGDVLDESELVARHTAAINADDYTVELSSLIAVHSIRVISDSEETGIDITNNRYNRKQFRMNSPELMSAWDTGTPTYWCHNVIRIAPDQIADDAAAFLAAGRLDYSDLHYGLSAGFKGLLFYPKADGDYTIEITGKFHDVVLSDTQTTSFWSIENPEAVLLAAQFCFERTVNNHAGQQASLAAVLSELGPMDRELVELGMATEPMELAD